MPNWKMARLLESWRCFGTNNLIFAEMKGLLQAVLIVLLSGSCIEHRPDNHTIVRENEQQPAEKVDKPKGKRVYEGKIPCADCSGIEQHLVLRGDTAGVFRLTEVYKDATEDGDEVIVTTGAWKYYKKKQQEKILFLSEGTLKDSSRYQRYLVNGSQLTQLDFNGQWIKSSNNYKLKLVSAK